MSFSREFPFFCDVAPLAPAYKKTVALPCKKRRVKGPRFSKKRDYSSHKGRRGPLIAAVDPPAVAVDPPSVEEAGMGISFEKMAIDWYEMEVGLFAAVSTENMIVSGSNLYSRIDLERHLREHKAFHWENSGAVHVGQLDTFFNDLPPYLFF